MGKVGKQPTLVLAEGGGLLGGPGELRHDPMTRARYPSEMIIYFEKYKHIHRIKSHFFPHMSFVVLLGPGNSEYYNLPHEISLISTLSSLPHKINDSGNQGSLLMED